MNLLISCSTGAGPPIPYRIYVDSGVVLLCLFAIAPASPLVAPAACLYFLLALPLLRWTHIFLYKPKFDVGGGRFPFIFDVCVSGMLVGQILLFTMMLLKKATGPAIAAITPFLPTIFFRFRLRTKYLGAFADAALLQTSLLVSRPLFLLEIPFIDASSCQCSLNRLGCLFNRTDGTMKMMQLMRNGKSSENFWSIVTKLL